MHLINERDISLDSEEDSSNNVSSDFYPYYYNNIMAEATKTISREWYEKLINELQELKQDKLPAVLEQIAEAKELWDLSENFDYKNALEEKDLINSRIKQIEDLIDWVEIIDSDKKSGEKTVWFWSKVIVQIEDDDPHEVTIVWTWEVKYQHGDTLISFDSPLGQAIRWKKVWEIAKMRLNNERKDVKVISIK